MRFLLDVGQGFRLAFGGLSCLTQHRTLWKWALLPAAVNIIVFAAAFAVFITFYPEIYSLATDFLHFEAPSAWYEWLWVAPLRLLTWLIGVLMLVVGLVILYVVFLILGTTIASPFLDVLAQRTEMLVTGHTREDATTFLEALRGIGKSIGNELRKLGFFLGVQLPLLVLSFIPLLTPFTTIAATLFTLLFLPLEYAGFAMDHRRLPFAARRALIRRHFWLMLGFGMAAFLTMLIPLLNFICLPVLVVGGTLLMLECDRREAVE